MSKNRNGIEISVWKAVAAFRMDLWPGPTLRAPIGVSSGVWRRIAVPAICCEQARQPLIIEFRPSVQRPEVAFPEKGSLVGVGWVPFTFLPQ